LQTLRELNEDLSQLEKEGKESSSSFLAEVLAWSCGCLIVLAIVLFLIAWIGACMGIK
jgi:hypothetical protein